MKQFLDAKVPCRSVPSISSIAHSLHGAVSVGFPTSIDLSAHGADRLFFADPDPAIGWEELIAATAEYAAAHIRSGGRLHHVTRHMIGLFQGISGARNWRQMLSSEAVRPGAGPEVLLAAFGLVKPALEEASPAEAAGGECSLRKSA